MSFSPTAGVACLGAVKAGRRAEASGRNGGTKTQLELERRQLFPSSATQLCLKNRDGVVAERGENSV